MMGCARNLTNIFKTYVFFYDFEEKVIKLLRPQTFIMFLARALKNIPRKVVSRVSACVASVRAGRSRCNHEPHAVRAAGDGTGASQFA